MSLKVASVISLLVFALLIQNTCPSGMAGKSTVAANCSHCPQKQMHTAPASPDGQVRIVSGQASPFPMYVLEMPHVQPVFQLAPIATPQPSIPNSYKDALPDELLRPPRA